MNMRLTRLREMFHTLSLVLKKLVTKDKLFQHSWLVWHSLILKFSGVNIFQKLSQWSLCHSYHWFQQLSFLTLFLVQLVGGLEALSQVWYWPVWLVLLNGSSVRSLVPSMHHLLSLVFTIWLMRLTLSWCVLLVVLVYGRWLPSLTLHRVQQYLRTTLLNVTMNVKHKFHFQQLFQLILVLLNQHFLVLTLSMSIH